MALRLLLSIKARSPTISFLATHPDVEEVLVFGSLPHGSYAPGEDIDVLLTQTGSDKGPRDRAADYLPRSFPVCMDISADARQDLERLTFLGPVAEAPRPESWRFTRSGG